MDGLVSLCAVLAPFVMVVLIVKMKHDQKMRMLGQQGVNADEQRALQDMSELARRMEHRIENLERILDSELAGWRSRTRV
jgi:phage shock protein B